MDRFFQELLQGDIFGYETVPPKQSAFVPYTNRPRNDFGLNNSNSGDGFNPGNMNKRMIELLRRNWKQKIEAQVPEREKTYRHMVNERMRRERQKQSFSALHSMLPPGTKNEKNSIVKIAAKRIQELQRCNEELKKRKCELEAILVAKKKENSGGTKINLTVPNPTSAVDFMVEVLKYLKNLGSKTTTIQAKFSAQELSAVMDIEPQIGADEVEEGVQRALQEVERKLLFHLKEA